MDQERLAKESEFMSPLQSWAPELRNMVGTPNDDTMATCDVMIERPTYIMKIDARKIIDIYLRFHITHDFML